MKCLTLSLCLLLSSCVAYRDADGTMFAMLGTDAEQVTAGNLSITEANQSKGLAKAGDAIRNIARLNAQRSIINSGIQAGQSIAQ